MALAAHLQTNSQTHAHNPLLLDRSDSLLLRKEGKVMTDMQRKLHDVMIPAYKVTASRRLPLRPHGE